MNLKETIAGINQMQADNVIGQYAIGGAVGASIYVEVGFTDDVDVFASLAATSDSLLIDLTSIYKYARARGWEETGPPNPSVKDI